MNKYLEHLINNPFIYYIYRTDDSIYGIKSDEESYLVVVNEKYILPKDFKTNEYLLMPGKVCPRAVTYDGAAFKFLPINEWFELVLSGNLLAWQCNCLSKKFIYKEYVKLLLKVDLMSMRKHYDICMSNLPRIELLMQKEEYKAAKRMLFHMIKDFRFSVQIIENHKIVNYHSVVGDYKALMETEDDTESIMKVFKKLNKDSGKVLCKYTDGVKAKQTEDKLKNLT